MNSAWLMFKCVCRIRESKLIVGVIRVGLNRNYDEGLLLSAKENENGRLLLLEMKA
jgi:hypothetical protein